MLHALKEYAVGRGIVSEPGFKAKTIRWLLTFERDGTFLGVRDLASDEKGSRGREFARCPHLSQPEIKAGGTGCRHFLVDSVDVVTLVTKSEPDDKLYAKHAYFVNCLEAACKAEPDLEPIVAALTRGSSLPQIQAKLKESKAKPTELVSFAVLDSDPSIIVERQTWWDWWRSFRRTLSCGEQDRESAERLSEPMMRCLLSGELVKPVKTHPKIGGLSDVGGLSMGDALASFKQPSFCSFGLEQAANSAMSEEMAEMYRATLDHLIKNNSRRLAGIRVVYWYIGDVRKDEDPMPELFDGFNFGQAEVEPSGDDMQPDNQQRHRQQAESRAARLLDAIRSGDQDALRLRNARYCALTLSGNSGRVVVRDWMEGGFESLLENIQAWFAHLTIVSRDGSSLVRSHKFAAVLSACVRDLADVPDPLVTAIWKTAMGKDQAIPSQAVAQTLARVRIDIVQDEPARHARFGLLKAYCIRNERMTNMTEELNTDLKKPAYLCGRIMALLADIQQVALGNVGAGITQRYYAAASATPGLVLGRLIRLAQTGHLPKIESDALRNWFEKQLAEIWQQMNRVPPSTLDLTGQTLFAMGYYQQKAQRFQGNKERDSK